MLAKSGRVIQLAWRKMCSILDHASLQARMILSFQFQFCLGPSPKKHHCWSLEAPDRHQCCSPPGGLAAHAPEQ